MKRNIERTLALLVAIIYPHLIIAAWEQERWGMVALRIVLMVGFAAMAVSENE